MSSDYININKESWNKKVDTHLKSEFYDMKSFLAGKNSLKDIELDLLPELKGKSVLHLQCHFGQDSLSMARLGADVVGVDLSDKSIEEARKINDQLSLNAEFICCDIFDLPKHLDRTFDIVFTSYGTIIWLPDLMKWASIVSRFLKPGASFIMADFHPVVWMFDDDFTHVKYNYFKADAIEETEKSSYADKDVELKNDYVCWNHGMSETLMSLINHNLELVEFKEFDYSPYDCFNGTTKIGESKYRIENMTKKLPMVFALKAKKKNEG